MDTETNIREILATAPSTYNMLRSAHSLLKAIEHQAALFDSAMYKELTPANYEKLKSYTENAADLAYRAQSVISAAAVLSDLHQIIIPPPTPAEDAAEEELPI